MVFHTQYLREALPIVALTTIDSSFIKDHRSVLVRLQHAERIHRTILGVDIPVTISLLIAGEFISHESTSCPSKDSSRIVRHHDWEASNPSRNHLTTSLSQRRSEVPKIGRAPVCTPATNAQPLCG